MKQNKYRRIAHKMGYYKNFENRYAKKPPERRGLQGVAMYFYDEIESVNERRQNKNILQEYELMKGFFDKMKNYYK